MDGKSDRLDAEQITRAVLAQTSTAIPKAKSGTVESGPREGAIDTTRAQPSERALVASHAPSRIGD